MWESHLESLLKSKGVIDESAICDCIRALYGEKLISLEIEFLKKYAQNESENIRIIISQNLLSVAKNSWLLSQELAKRLIKHTCSRKLLDNICRALIRNRPEQFKESPTKVESRILNLLIEIDELRDYGCREFIVKFARREPKILLRLVEERHKLKKSLYELKNIFRKVIPDWKKRKDFHQIFEKICTWANQGVRLNPLANEVLGLLYDDNILQMVKSSINHDNPNSIIKAAQIASNFPKSDNFFDLFAKLFELAEPHGDKIFETVASRFSSAAWTGAWSRSTGQPSDFHLNIKTQCERILSSKNLSIRVRKVFESNIKGVDQAIQDDLNGDRELFEL